MGASDDEGAGGAGGPALPFAVTGNVASIPVPPRVAVPGESPCPLAHQGSWPSHLAFARVCLVGRRIGGTTAR